MKLKSLEIKGFKSFADKTHIILDHPITGIVGPNGCGKSNIVDAIRWVIGEHKIKALRSDNLEDLIFNGSRTRTASGMAEVSLTFENTRNLLPTDFTTVTITRKFYKNGESEYRLNDVSCRLKDIHNLFLDTGVSNDSYAIIELGMVDDIIKDKEGSRRRMLEQAAGISIYKTRKKEAKQKLESTEQDVSRIEDLLFEIGNNLRTLESQAKKAEKYFQLKDAYKATSIELAKASLEQFNSQYKSLQEQLDLETDRKSQIEAQVATEEASIEQQKLDLIAKEQELNSLQKQFNDLLHRIRTLEGEKKLTLQKVTYLKEREDNTTQFLAGADEKVEQLIASIDFSTLNVADEQKVLEQMRIDLDLLRKEVDEKRVRFDDQKKTLEVLRSEHGQKQRSQFDAEKKVAIADTSVLNLQRSLQQVMDEKNQRTHQIELIGTDQTQTELHLADKQDELVGLLERQEEVKAKILDSQAAMEQLRATLAEENRKLDSKRNEHDLLKSLVESLEGYPDSIKFLKKNKEWNNSAPLLSDVFVVQHEYRTALENVLDSYLNYYLVPQPSDAAQALQLLENNKKGKANFFIINKLAANTATPPVAPPNTIPALSVVSVEEKYATLAQKLLGHVYITAHMQDVDPATVTENTVIVEQSGKRILGQYSIGGGSVGLFEGNKIGRAKNLERLALEITELTQSAASLKQYIADTQTLLAGFNQELNDKTIDQTKQEIYKLQNHIVNLKNKIENFEHLNQNGTERMAVLQDQIADTQESIEDTRILLAEVSDKVKELAAQIMTAEATYKQAEQAYYEISNLYNQNNLLTTKQQSKVETLKQELLFKNNQLVDLKKQVDANKEQLALINTQLTDTNIQLSKCDEDLYELMLQKESEEKVLNEKDRSFYTFRNEVGQIEGKINQKRRERDQAETLVQSFKDKINAMKLQVAGLSERLSIEFKVKLDDILDQPRDNEESIEYLTSECDRMKKRMENLGEVNTTAIEAFSEMKVRHDFIAEQRDDLVNARASLLNTIEEVEQTANNKFKETFDLVRLNFVHVFKALFTEEDNCDLRLTDPNNVADSNIEIYAQPKGKKPSTLTQLSGGEKTLTSTAFLFAIYLIKPAPFCILDEVDAPLDDANVGKFTQMIRKFSDNSQFIIVTHNKQTMASVDVIYGVTMQEPGVSKLVPVDFRSLN